jgi:RimJ/RimL family protein N-acetyltransferase
MLAWRAMFCRRLHPDQQSERPAPMQPLAHSSNLQLLTLQVNTLFLIDPQQRLLAINEPGQPAAPRFFLGRSAGGNLWRFRSDLPAEMIAQLDQLCQREPHSLHVAHPPGHEHDIRAELARHAPIQNEYRGPAYILPPLAVSSPQLVLLSRSHAPLVQETFPWLVDWLATPANGPVAAVVDQERAVSVCFCSRITPLAAEAGLETVPAYRGKGYAPRAVSGWAAAIQRSGRLALYSTSWDNHASQRVASKLGARLYGEDWSIT